MGPKFQFPRPADWPDRMDLSDPFYHEYSQRYETKGSPACIAKYIRNHPTPGSSNAPATPGGQLNDAQPPMLKLFGSSPVMSYVRPFEGGEVIVNVTEPGHPLHPGYVARWTSGRQSPKMHVYGEGTSVLQSTYNPMSGAINSIWKGQATNASNACSCGAK